MDYIIHSYEGVELPDGRRITFDMTTDDVSELLGEPDRFQQSDPEYSDHFGYDYVGSHDIAIHFNGISQKIEGIVMGPRFQVCLDGFPLVGDFYEVKKHLDSIGGEVIDAVGQLHYLKVGVAIYNSQTDEEPIGASSHVTAFVKGLVDNWEEEREQRRQKIVAMPKLSEEERRAEMDELLHIDLDKFLES